MTIVLNETILNVIKSLLCKNKLSVDLDKFLLCYTKNIDEKFTENLVNFYYNSDNRKDVEDEYFNEFIHGLACYLSQLLEMEQSMNLLNKFYTNNGIREGNDLVYRLDSKGNVQVKRIEYSKIGF